MGDNDFGLEVFTAAPTVPEPGSLGLISLAALSLFSAESVLVADPKDRSQNRHFLRPDPAPRDAANGK